MHSEVGVKLDDVSGGSGSIGDTKMVLTPAPNAFWSVGNVAGEGIDGTAAIVEPASNVRTTIVTDGFYTSGNEGRPVRFNSGGRRNANSVVDGVRFLFSSGNMQDGTIIMEVHA